jgi:hypothetical protein
MFRLMLLGPAAVVVGLTAGWMVPADTPGASSSRAPINIAPAHVVRTQPLSAPTATPTATSDAPEATSEPLASGRIARKRKQLKSRLAATAVVAKPSPRPTRCNDDDDDEC